MGPRLAPRTGEPSRDPNDPEDCARPAPGDQSNVFSSFPIWRSRCIGELDACVLFQGLSPSTGTAGRGVPPDAAAAAASW